jgi:hypothetical protein
MDEVVTRRALIDRINRKLSRDGEVLRKLRGEIGLTEFGRHYVVDGRNLIVDRFVDPESYGRELGVLAEWEQAGER